jgi:RNA polymerase sigma-70 factor (ECF subfamily)
LNRASQPGNDGLAAGDRRTIRGQAASHVDFGEPLVGFRISEVQVQVSTLQPNQPSLETELLVLTDEQLVARIRAGESSYFELLMRRHNRRVFRATRAIVKRDDEAEDVMQDAYVRAYEHLAEFRGDATFATWVTRIAVHEALARVRREQRFRSVSPPAEEPSAMLPDLSRTPEQLTNDQELRRVLERAIDALPDDFRAVFVMRAVEQMTGAETAECLGIPEETVKTRLHRARHRLQETVQHAFEANCERAYEFHLSRCDRVVARVFARLGFHSSP